MRRILHTISFVCAVALSGNVYGQTALRQPGSSDTPLATGPFMGSLLSEPDASRLPGDGRWLGLMNTRRTPDTILAVNAQSPDEGPMAGLPEEYIPGADAWSTDPDSYSTMEDDGPALEYIQVRPPTSVFQQVFGQTYRTVLTPGRVFLNDPLLSSGINLLRPDGLAPTGVTNDHTLPDSNRIFMSYRFSHSEFDDNFNGTHRVSDASVLANFPIAPTHRSVDTHTIRMEYAPTSDLTFTAQVPLMRISMNHVSGAGGTIRTNESNMGDVPISALYVLKRWNGQQLHLNAGISLPLGVLSAERYTPGPMSPDLSYPLRVSSGTYDLMPGLTYRGQSDYWTWGVQNVGTLRLGHNDLGYRLGNQYYSTAWASRRWSDCLSTSGRVEGQVWGNTRGADANLDPTLVPTNRPDLQRGGRINLLVGVNYFIPCRYVNSQWLTVEGGAPVYQSLAGPQLGQSWIINAGYNFMF